MQAVAKKQISSDCTVLVIGEPPPQVTIAELVGQIDIAESPSEVLVEKNSFGGDGWTKDLVVTIDGDPPEEAANTISLLHRYLFGTSFRAWTIDLDAPPSEPRPDSLNLNVTAGDLDGWVFRSRETFTSVFGGRAQTASELLEQAPVGVYEAATAPLVAWVLEPALDLDSHTIEARQFTMASDLTLGALFSNTRVVVIGRARSIPFERLPPLRTETLKLLAGAKQSLGQSYERTNPLAGVHGPLSRHMSSWAPIYLSPELIDTEYGSLLNLTDQLLKSWSSAGETRYTLFSYPDPPHWPFGNQSAYAFLGAESLTYNWNTRDFASAYLGARRGIVSFRATGALPLDYLPSSGSTPESEKASAVGRMYFAKVGDPNLARVVQYAGLYHVFQTAKLSTKPDAGPERAPDEVPEHTSGSPSVEDAAYAMLSAYANATDAALRALSDRIFDALVPKEVPRTEAALASAAEHFLSAHHASTIAGAAEPRLRALAKLWASPPARPTPAQQRDLEACMKARAFMHGLVDLDKLRNDYLATLPARGDSWIRTSTWVTSTSSAMREGGHNIDFALRPVERVPPARQWQAVLGAPREQVAREARGAGGWSRTASRGKGAALARHGQTRSWVARLERTNGYYRVSFGDRPQEFTAHTVADASELISNAARSSGVTRPVRLHLQGFNAAEARNFRTQTERALRTSGGNHQVETVAFRRVLDPASARRFSEPRVFHRLSVEEAQILDSRTMTAPVTVKPPGKLRQILMRIKLVFRDRVSEPLRVRVAGMIDSALSRFGGKGSLGDLSTHLHRDLSARLKAEGISVSIELINEAEDIFVVERDRAMAHTRS